MTPEQGWQCPICKRIYNPRQEMCLYCGGGNAPKQSDKTQPYIPDQGYTWATNMLDITTTSTLNGVSNLSNCVIEGSGINTSISLSCGAYCDKYCLATKEPFITSCEGKKEKCENEYGFC